ncbi:MAG TPA: hypothetical protein VJR04_06200, partial [Terriglobales bacterium]|nr:hypothetical protein [Terriglobales bacterium]
MLKTQQVTYLALFTWLITTACNQNTRPIPENKAPAQSSTPFTAVDPATAASIHGVIHFTGNAPAPVQIDMGMDPGCTIDNHEPNFSQQYVVNHGALANVY